MVEGPEGVSGSGDPDIPEAATEGLTFFPCTQCGATLEFAPGADSMQCPYCGHTSEVERTSEEPVEEQDFAAVLRDLEAGAEMEEVALVKCTACAAEVEPPPSTEAFACPYCGHNIVATATSKRQIKPQGLLPFKIERRRATELFRGWIDKLWFAPNALKKMARLDRRLQGLYAPYWTFDAGTRSAWRGQRGDDYQVRKTRTVTRDGKRVTEHYTETRTRWTNVSGTYVQDFDDVLVVASESLPRSLAQELEPWDLENVVSYEDGYLAGFQAERYQVPLPAGWTHAKARMDDVIRSGIKRQIGGDHQRITWLVTHHSGVTFKHLLLPMWICSYRYREKVYRFLVNARTGEVQGERPWSVWKIAFAVLTVLTIAFVVWRLTQG